MWNDRKSVTLSIVCTKIAVVLVIAAAVHLSLLFVHQYINFRSSMMFTGVFYYPVLVTCCVPSLIALVCLHRMLLDIRTGTFFTIANVRRLRAISWCSLSICVLFLSEIFFLPWWSFHFRNCAVAGFFSLLTCIIKNVFDAARRIKDENDYTI